jgi:hypothetical protein
MGSGGNFDETLKIDGAGRITPRGPLVENDNLMTGIYVWVFQTRDDGSSAAYTGELEEEDFEEARDRQGIGEVGERETVWDMAGADPTLHGKLQPGPATALALAISKKQDGTKPVTWWTDQITLVLEDETSA